MKTLIIVSATLILSACGGGGSGGENTQTSANGAGGNQPTESVSFKETSTALLQADENSEPMDIMAVSMKMDIDDDETAFEDLMSRTVSP